MNCYFARPYLPAIMNTFYVDFGMSQTKVNTCKDCPHKAIFYDILTSIVKIYQRITKGYKWLTLICVPDPRPWWRHQMETFPVLLALCAGNSPVTGEFPSQRPAWWASGFPGNLQQCTPWSFVIHICIIYYYVTLLEINLLLLLKASDA